MVFPCVSTEIALWLQRAVRPANYVTTLQECIVDLSSIRGNLIIAQSSLLQNQMYSKDIKYSDKVGKDLKYNKIEYKTIELICRPAASGEHHYMQYFNA